MEAVRLTEVVNYDWLTAELAGEQRGDPKLRQFMDWRQSGLRPAQNDIEAEV